MVVLPEQIEATSFQIITSELAQLGKPTRSLTAEEHAVLVRVIHATADFEFADNLRFHKQAVPSALAALRRGAAIVADVRMVQVGINARNAGALGCTITCDVSHPEVVTAAREAGTTRSVIAMRRNAALIENGIVVIGNAPTALLEVIRLVHEDGVQPALIVGVPVGFVNAVESKAILGGVDVPYITAQGRKGGSSVAVAIMNALLLQAVAQ